MQRVRCVLKTTGGDCSRLVANSLGDLFQRLGINPFIYYDRDEFQLHDDAGGKGGRVWVGGWAGGL